MLEIEEVVYFGWEENGASGRYFSRESEHIHQDCRTAAFLPCFGECHNTSMSCHTLTRFEVNAEVDCRVWGYGGMGMYVWIIMNNNSFHFWVLLPISWLLHIGELLIFWSSGSEEEEEEKEEEASGWCSFVCWYYIFNIFVIPVNCVSLWAMCI